MIGEAIEPASVFIRIEFARNDHNLHCLILFDNNNKSLKIPFSRKQRDVGNKRPLFATFSYGVVTARRASELTERLYDAEAAADTAPGVRCCGSVCAICMCLCSHFTL